MIKFLEVKRAYYADPENVAVEYWNDQVWEICENEPKWSPGLEYRIRPRTIRIGEIDVPEPVRDASAMHDGQDYFMPAIEEEKLCAFCMWNDHKYDSLRLSRGLIHLTKEAAIAHAKALIIVSGGKV